MSLTLCHHRSRFHRAGWTQRRKRAPSGVEGQPENARGLALKKTSSTSERQRDLPQCSVSEVRVRIEIFDLGQSPMPFRPRVRTEGRFNPKLWLAVGEMDFLHAVLPPTQIANNGQLEVSF